MRLWRGELVIWGYTLQPPPIPYPRRDMGPEIPYPAVNRLTDTDENLHVAGGKKGVLTNKVALLATNKL